MQRMENTSLAPTPTADSPTSQQSDRQPEEQNITKPKNSHNGNSTQADHRSKPEGSIEKQSVTSTADKDMAKGKNSGNHLHCSTIILWSTIEPFEHL